MTTAILSVISHPHRNAAAALEMATEMLEHRHKISAVITALIAALRTNGDAAGVLPLAQVAEDLALDTDQDGRLIECLEAMQTPSA